MFKFPNIPAPSIFVLFPNHELRATSSSYVSNGWAAGRETRLPFCGSYSRSHQLPCLPCPAVLWHCCVMAAAVSQSLLFYYCHWSPDLLTALHTLQLAVMKYIRWVNLFHLHFKHSMFTFLSLLVKNSSKLLKGSRFEGNEKYDINWASQSQYNNIAPTRIER